MNPPLNDIDTKDGLVDELGDIMQRFRHELNMLTINEARTSTITQLRQLEQNLFDQAMKEVFDTVHASCYWDEQARLEQESSLPEASKATEPTTATHCEHGVLRLGQLCKICDSDLLP